MIAAALFALAACLPVSAGSDRILARDLVPALPELSALPPETPLAAAPEPGVTRVFHIPELRRLAVRWQLAAEPAREICVTRPVTKLDPAALLEAMRSELPGAHIEILEFSRQPAPEGPIEFPRQGLRRGTSGSLWMGWVRYAGNRRFSIWARVAITATIGRVLAVGDLKPGQPIAARQVMLATSQEFPGNEPWSRSLADVVGKYPRFRIPAGTAIRIDALTDPQDVMRGQTVRVEIRNGGAVLELDGTAEASGGIGDTIPVLNPGSQKRFQARVEGKGRVAVSLPLSR
jgi:flagella basal body P-ring formation protein FlgA